MTKKGTLLRVIKEASDEKKQKDAAKDHWDNYHLRSSLAMDNEEAGRPLIAAKHRKAAEYSAKVYHTLTGEKIHDPLYTGSIPHIAKKLDEATYYSPEHHEAEFWYNVNAAMKFHELGSPRHAEKYERLAHRHARHYYDNSNGKKIKVGGTLDGMDSPYIDHS